MDGTLVAPDWPPLTLAELRTPFSPIPRPRRARSHPHRQPASILRGWRGSHRKCPRLRQAPSSRPARSRGSARRTPFSRPSPRSRRIRPARPRLRIGRNRNPNRRLDLRSPRNPRRHRSLSKMPSPGPPSTPPPMLTPPARLSRAFISPRKTSLPRPASPARSSPASPSSQQRIPRPRFATTLPRARRSRITKLFAPAPSKPSNSSRPFHADLAPLLPALTPLWTHNDLHASNLFWSESGPNARATAIIDFGLADRTNAVHDLAHAIERNIVEWLDTRPN